ncbi:MAG: drug resistance transporter, EmrB/QacA subfamily [Actinomycetia bacterium]|nr:drug resistance transporter, EmrB/QacA subfamily [Actinomycetes bacterium]
MSIEQATLRNLEYERRWWTLGVLCVSLVMIVVANASLNVALPTLVRDLHASASSLQWIVDAYSLVFAGLLLTAGSLGDRYGRRLALNGGLVVFGIASLMAALSHSATALIAARAVMGIGAAFVMPATLSVLAHVFPPDERPRAIAIWAGFAGVGAALGGVSSGWLLQHFWWGSIFLTNVGVVALALIAGAILVPKAHEKRHAPLDPIGALLSIVGLGTLIYTIIEAPGHGWLSATTVGTFAVSALVLVGFARWELHVREPMLDLRFFRDPRFTAATTTITFVFLVMFGTFFIITQYLQSVLGYSPLSAGVRILPWALAYMLSTTRSARLVERFGQRLVVSSGLAIVGAGLLLMSRSSVHSNYPLFALALVISAVGMGFTTAPSTGAIMRSLPLEKAGVGSAVNDTTRELGGALGVAALGSILTSSFHGSLTASVRGLPDTATHSIGNALQQAATLPAPRGALLADAARHAYVHAFDATLTIAVVVAVVAAGTISWLLRPNATQPVEAEGIAELEAA